MSSEGSGEPAQLVNVVYLLELHYKEVVSLLATILCLHSMMRSSLFEMCILSVKSAYLLYRHYANPTCWSFHATRYKNKNKNPPLKNKHYIYPDYRFHPKLAKKENIKMKGRYIWHLIWVYTVYLEVEGPLR